MKMYWIYLKLVDEIVDISDVPWLDFECTNKISLDDWSVLIRFELLAHAIAY